MGFAAAAGPAVPPAARLPAATIDATLAPFEHGRWPATLEALSLNPARSYVILAQIPSAWPFDLSRPAVMQASTAQILRDPWGRIRAGTTLGHMMVGWHCAGDDGEVVRGFTSKTGGDGLDAIAMAAAGWGMGALLGSFDDGRLVPLDNMGPDHLRVLAAGRGHVLAAEVSAGQCAGLRAALTGYVTHPANPARRYSMVPDPAAMTGDGCLTFALWLAGRGGAMAGLAPALTRQVPLRDSYIGRASWVPRGVRPLPVPADLAPVALGDLWAADWSGGAPLGDIALLDGELIFAALTGLRGAAGLPDAWHRARSLPATDADVARARAAVLDWARDYPVWRQADAGGIGGLILERAEAGTAMAGTDR